KGIQHEIMGLKEIRADLCVTRSDILQVGRQLRDWYRRLRQLSSEVREHTGEPQLIEALGNIRDALIGAISQESELTRQTIASGLDRLARLLQEEKSKLQLDAESVTAELSVTRTLLRTVITSVETATSGRATQRFDGRSLFSSVFVEYLGLPSLQELKSDFG